MEFSPRYRHIADNLLAPLDAPPFTYSDGEVEEYIAKVVAEASDRSLTSFALAAGINDWASHYHLSHTRSYLLRPLQDLLQKSRVLELGAGCGALTRYLGEI